MKLTSFLPARPTHWSNLRHLPAQKEMLKAIGRTALLALRQKTRSSATLTLPNLPGPTLTAELPPRPPELIEAYLKLVGGSAERWSGQLPPHLFAQWGFPLIQRTLEDLPYPTLEFLNAGVHLEIRSPIPADEELSLKARLIGIHDDGRNVTLTTELITSTASAPEALRVEFRAVWRHPRRTTSAPSKPKSESSTTLPANSTELKRWSLSPNSGLEFALMTGDFNPIHWIPLAARLSGFKFTILHGFDSFARTYEALLDQGFSVKKLDVNFVRPLILPQRANGLELSAWHHEGQVFVAPSLSGPVYLRGHVHSGT